MDLEDKIRFALSTIRPMAEYTLPYLASVIGVADPKTGSHVGSAVRCLIDGRRVLVTALHVIEQAVREYPAVAISAGYGAPPYQVRGEVRFEPLDDLAIYPLPEDYPSREGVEFWPETRIDTDPDRVATDYLFLHGFPGERSYSSQLLSGVVSKSLPYGCMQRVRAEGLPDDLRDEVEFAVHFDPRDIRGENGGRPDGVPNPRGLSGSPVWRVGASGRPTTEWTPRRSLLVGIVKEWRTDRELLVATRAGRILSLLGQAQ